MPVLGPPTHPTDTATCLSISLSMITRPSRWCESSTIDLIVVVCVTCRCAQKTRRRSVCSSVFSVQSSVQRGRKGVDQSHCTIHHSIVLSPHCNITLLCRKDPVRCSAPLPYPPLLFHPLLTRWRGRKDCSVLCPGERGRGLQGFPVLHVPPPPPPLPLPLPVMQ